jgi:hypothetical protein
LREGERVDEEREDEKQFDLSLFARLEKHGYS